MTLRLFILRHLKTGWALPGQQDVERRLEPRGESDAELVRGWIRSHGFQPGHIYCSSATRTRQTLEHVLPAFGTEPGVSLEEALYHGTADTYLEILELHPEAENLMIIGHNPSCAGLANLVIDRAKSGSGDPAMAAISYKYPTGALAVFEFEIDHWSKLRAGTAHLTHFLMPKDFRPTAEDD